jgi:hypothetical protein
VLTHCAQPVFPVGLREGLATGRQQQLLGRGGRDCDCSGRRCRRGSVCLLPAQQAIQRECRKSEALMRAPPCSLWGLLETVVQACMCPHPVLAGALLCAGAVNLTGVPVSLGVQNLEDTEMAYNTRGF